MCGIGGAKMVSFAQVDFVKHYGSKWDEVCFLRVNGTHALLLSDTQGPDDGSAGKRAGYWGDDGLTLVAVCCEELPVSWQRVESEPFWLTSWEPDAGIHYLCLAELSAFPVFQTPIHHGIHPFVDEFHRSLMGVVEAEHQFREIPPEQWNQYAWRGFYKLVAASFGGKLFMKPVGAMKRPFCRREIALPGMDLVLEDSSLCIVLYGDPELESKFRVFTRNLLDQEEASLLCFESYPDQLDTTTETLLIGDLPEEERLTVMLTIYRNFFIQQEDGLVDLQKTLTRLLAARDFVIRASQCFPEAAIGFTAP